MRFAKRFTQTADKTLALSALKILTKQTEGRLILARREIKFSDIGGCGLNARRDLCVTTKPK